MNIGSEEWTEKAKENYQFPCMIAVYYTSEKRFVSAKIKTKSINPSKINYGSVAPPYFIGGVTSALCGVYYMEDVQQYALEVKKIMKSFEGDKDE